MLAEEVSSDSRLETNCGSDIQSNDKGWRGWKNNNQRMMPRSTMSRKKESFEISSRL
jgi:hypothetical protein